MQRNFYLSLFRKIINSVPNNYQDNFDFTRYDEELKKPILSSAKALIKRYLNSNNDLNVRFEHYLKAIELNEKDYSHFNYLFDHLELRSSKNLLIDIVAYRLMGHSKVKLPLNDSSFRRNYEHIISLRSEWIDSTSLNNVLKLYKHDITSLGFPLKLILSSYGILIDFVHKQYQFDEEVKIKAEEGDFVIDGGGCYGDTALYFSHRVGVSGKVYSFEFVPSNLKIFEKNLQLNPNYSSNIFAVENALSNEAGKKIYFRDRGPASTVSTQYSDLYTEVTETVTIDKYMETNGINKMDLIKLDIEGSEYNTIYGAKQTIKKYKPKLAIALYHSTDDFERIPRLIKEIEPGYKFYLKHATINQEETMLFAYIKN